MPLFLPKTHSFRLCPAWSRRLHLALFYAGLLVLVALSLLCDPLLGLLID
jgi:hypothetical protein